MLSREQHQFFKNKMKNKNFLLISVSTIFFLGFLFSFGHVFAQGVPDPNAAMNGVVIPTDTGLAGSTVEQILTNLLKWILGILGVIAIISFIISGVQYLISYGNEDTMERAKRNMMYSIIGVTVALAAVVIIQAIDLALRASM